MARNLVTSNLDWDAVPAEGNVATIYGTSLGQQLCIRARHTTQDGNVSAWEYITHSVSGKTEPTKLPKRFIVIGAAGQIAARWEPPEIPDYDRIQICVTTNQEPSDKFLSYEGQQTFWTSENIYNPNRIYYVFIRGLDTSGNAGPWSPGMPITPETLTNSTATIHTGLNSTPSLLLGNEGDLFVQLTSHTLYAKSENIGWWNTKIKTASDNAEVYSLQSSETLIPQGENPGAGKFGIPVESEIPKDSVVVGSDGRVWEWSLAFKTFIPKANLLSKLRQPNDLPDVSYNRTPALCGDIIRVNEIPPKDIPETLIVEGIEGETKPPYLVAFSDNGTIADNINGGWLVRSVRLKPQAQKAVISRQNSIPSDWTDLDRVPVLPSGVSQYGEEWDIRISTSQQNDINGDSYYGQSFIRNFRTRRWEKHVALCDPQLPEPAVPTDLYLRSSDGSGELINIQIGWNAPASRISPLRYRYRVFPKPQFESDGTRLNIMQGPTAFTTYSENGVTVPHKGQHFLEVRAEYASANSRWVRLEGFVGNLCARLPNPEPPSIRFFSSTGNTEIEGPNRVRQVLGTSGNPFRIDISYPGSGTRGTRYRQYAPGYGIGRPRNISGTTDVFSGTSRHGLHAAAVTQILDCAGAEKESRQTIADILITPAARTEQGGSLRDPSDLEDITPSGAPAGTHTFRYNNTWVVDSDDPSRTEVEIKGYQKNPQEEYVPLLTPTLRAITITAGSLSVTQNPRFAGRKYIQDVSQGLKTIVVSGIPTDFNGFYSISVRASDTSEPIAGNHFYSRWISIRFGQTGTAVILPPPSINPIRSLRGNESPNSRTAWEFAWMAPTLDGLNKLRAIDYRWNITGATLRNGINTRNRLSVTQLNDGAHTITVQPRNGEVVGPPVSFPFFVRSVGTPKPPLPLNEPENLRVTVPITVGARILSWDVPSIGVRPTSYAWRLTGPVTDSGLANPTTVGGSVRLSNLTLGQYTFYVKSKAGALESDEVSIQFRIVTQGPEQPFPPSNVLFEEGASRTSWNSSWNAPAEGVRPDGYETRITGATTQAIRPTINLNDTHTNLNTGQHKGEVRSTKVGELPSVWVPYNFVVRAEGCNPVESLETGVGNLWSTQNFFWAVPIGGMAPEGYLWELQDSANSTIQNGTVTTTQHSIQNLTEGQYTFRVRTNCATGPSEAKSVGFRIECPSPEPPERLAMIVSGLIGQLVANATWAHPTAGATPLGYVWELAGAESRNGEETATTVSLALVGLPNGSYVLSLRTKGDCNKLSEEITVGFKIGTEEICNPPRLLRKREGTIWSTWTVLWLGPTEGDNPTRYDWRLVGPTSRQGSVDPTSTYTGQVTMENLRVGSYTFFVKSICGSVESGETSIGITVVERNPRPPKNPNVESVTAGFVGQCPVSPNWIGTWEPPDEGNAPSNYEWELHNSQTNLSDSTKTLDSITNADRRRALLGRLGSGNYTFRVRSVVGTFKSGWASKTFTIEPEDFYAPNLETPERTVTGITERLVFNWMPNPCGIQPDSYEFRIRRLGAAVDTESGPVSSTSLVRNYQPASAGNYRFYVLGIKGTRRSPEASIGFNVGEATTLYPPEFLTNKGSEINLQYQRLNWQPPSRGTAPDGYRYQLIGPTPDSGTTIADVRRKEYTNLADGNYTFRVWSTAGAAESNTYAEVGFTINVGEYVNDPTDLKIEETESIALGIAVTTRTATWNAPPTTRRVGTTNDPETVTGYGYSYAKKGQLGTQGTTAANVRRVDLSNLEAGEYSFTVWAIAGTVTSRNVTEEFTVRAETLEPPSEFEITFERMPANIFEWKGSFEPPTSGKRPTGYSWRIEQQDGDHTEMGTLDSTIEEFTFDGIPDGSYTAYIKSTIGSEESEEVSQPFTQPPPQPVEPPTNLAVSTGEGSLWNTANASWEAPTEGDPPDDYIVKVTGPTASEETTTALVKNLTALAAGSYTISVRSRKGDSSSEPVTRTFRITEPNPNPVEGLGCEPGANRTSKLVSWSAPSSGVTTPEGYEYRVTGATTQAIETTQNLSVVINNLRVGTSTVQVRSYKEQLRSQWRSVDCKVEAASVKPPRNVTVTESDSNRLNWIGSWDEPEEDDDGTLNITGYEWRLTGEISRNGTTVTIVRTVNLSGLTVGDYVFSVRSVRGTETSDWVSRGFSIEPEPLNAPTITSVNNDATATPPRNITVNWTAPEEGRTPTGYEVRLTGTSTVAATAVSGTSYTFNNLAAGSYTVYVRSTIGQDKSTDEDSETFDIETPALLPTEPEGLTHSLSEDGTVVTYNWEPPSEINGTLETYKWNQTPGDSGDIASTSHQISGLTVGRRYTFTVAAENEHGVGPAASVSFTAEARLQRPNPVQNLSHELDIVSSGVVGTVIGTTVSVTLNWEPNDEGAAPDSYEVTLTGEDAQTVTGTSARFTDIGTGIKTATVIAINEAGRSDPERISFTAVDGFPPNPVRGLDMILERGVIGGQSVADWQEPLVDSKHFAATSYKASSVYTYGDGTSTSYEEEVTEPRVVFRGSVTKLLSSLETVSITVIASNKWGDSEPRTVSVSGADAANQGSPNTPEGFSASSFGAGGFTLSWSSGDVDNEGSITAKQATTDYYIYLAVNTHDGSEVGGRTDGTTATVNVPSFLNIPNGTQFNFYVWAVNSAGQSAPASDSDLYQSADLTDPTDPNQPGILRPAPPAPHIDTEGGWQTTSTITFGDVIP